MKLITLMGFCYLILIVFLVYTLAAFWPGVQIRVEQADGTTISDWDPGVTWFGQAFGLPTEMRLLWLVVIAAALGSYVHTVTSFASYVGNQTFAKTWLWWYLLRPPIGVALALVFYFLIRGGLLSSGALGSEISPFGVAAISGLVGMFSKQATDKLRETFDYLFRTEGGDSERRDKLEGGFPVIESLQPAAVPADGSAAEIRIRGKNFSEGATATVGGLKRDTEFKSETEIVLRLAPEDTASPGKLKIVVVAAPPSKEKSKPADLEVTKPQDLGS